MKRKASDGAPESAAKRQQQYATYNPPRTPWLAAVGCHLPFITRAFAEAAVKAWDGSSEDKCAASMKELLDYAQKSPWINMLIGVCPYPGDMTQYRSLVATKDQYWFAYYAGYKVVISDDLNDPEYPLNDDSGNPNCLVSSEEIVNELFRGEVPEGYDTLEEDLLINWIRSDAKRAVAFEAWRRKPVYTYAAVRACLRKAGAPRAADEESGSD